MIETRLPLAPDPRATVPAPDPAPLLEPMATLRLANAVLRAQKLAPHQAVQALDWRRQQANLRSSA
jgi:hypothetical protein